MEMRFSSSSEMSKVSHPGWGSLFPGCGMLAETLGEGNHEIHSKSSAKEKNEAEKRTMDMYGVTA